MMAIIAATLALADVSADNLKATVEKLASFQTRNTLSPTLKEAAGWLADQFRAIPGLEVEVWEYTAPKGPRVPNDMPVVEVVAVLKGESDRRILMGGHMDSLNLQVDPVTGRAPGANDDGSGVAATLETARLMAAAGKPKNTCVFVAFSGEEQGLLGARALAARAKAENWKLEAVLNNDTVGSSGNKAGQKDDKRVRVFSEEPTAENPTAQSRELARYAEWVVRHQMKGFGVKRVFRRDRFGRGGDHTPFHQAGYAAVRFVEVHEEYTRQHTPDDLPEHMDWRYLAQVTRANLTLMSQLANAALPPTSVRVKNDQSHDTTLTWAAEPGTEYVVYWRETTSPTWEQAKPVGKAGTYVIPKVNKDDHIFAVGAVGGVPAVAR